MSHVFSSWYFSLIKADKLQREGPIYVSTPLVLGIRFVYMIRTGSFPTPEIENRAAKSRYAYSKIRQRVFYLLPALCFLSDQKSFPTYQRKIDSVSSSSRKPHFKLTR